MAHLQEVWLQMTLVLGAPPGLSCAQTLMAPSPCCTLSGALGEEVGFVKEADRAHPHGTWAPNLAARPPSLHVGTSFEVAALMNLSPLKGSLRTAPGTHFLPVSVGPPSSPLLGFAGLRSARGPPLGRSPWLRR